ncbi:sulfatase-like hydrolase/transferase [Marispirochaeta sp.]|uniref:sulfatase-like hydrolase/transferase n=1 Tax=Marispirochaeta sp. TaxID=2038653 RepID=UPI0029C60DE8|nr:sulfatase-like hydrolase/transferase [Marispirochaeta sp.]
MNNRKNKSVCLLTKEVLHKSYLPVYGGEYWDMPNFTELAHKGTVFQRHYAAAPSTAMSVTCLFSGLWAHELERRYYSEVEYFDQVPTLFNIFQDKGYTCHVVWDAKEQKMTYPYTKCYGDREKTVFHDLQRLTNPSDDEFLNHVYSELNSIPAENTFIWMHLPHVLYSRSGYGTDMDLFDKIIGRLRQQFGDDSLYISGDHGHMNLRRGIPAYGFHVYDDVLSVPMITPRVDGRGIIEYPTSHKQLKDLILHGMLRQEEFVYGDTQYYLQPNRKLAIIKGRYKYIFNKYENTEELYDLEWDPTEEVNLLFLLSGCILMDPNRMRKYKPEIVFFYPFKQEALDAFNLLRQQKDKIWRQGSFTLEFLKKAKFRYKRTLYHIKKFQLKRKQSMRPEAISRRMENSGL